MEWACDPLVYLRESHAEMASLLKDLARGVALLVARVAGARTRQALGRPGRGWETGHDS
jgi:hypothetical protein